MKIIALIADAKEEIIDKLKIKIGVESNQA